MDEGCTEGACEAGCPTGCAVLTTNVIAADAVGSTFDYNLPLATPVDLSGTTITVRLRLNSSVRPEDIWFYINDSTDDANFGPYFPETVAEAGWYELSAVLRDTITTAGNVDTLGFELLRLNTNGTSLILVDSISVEPPVVGPWEFATPESVEVIVPDNTDPEVVSGSVDWLGAD